MVPRLLFLVTALLAAGLSARAQSLQAFRLPWNDASSGPTNLRSWQPGAAGVSGWVSIDAEGHYRVGGERIRFLGVNVGAADCFPTLNRAQGHAARLARFGFNAVRFHHMEAPWDKSAVLVDYPTGSSRTLNAVRLDRLHAFIAELAAQGVYSNLNLLVSREFQATDGLGPEITQLGWKDQHVLGFFMADALALHKEYATQLLTSRNPYRANVRLADDPAVAFVEIMNENGLAQKWYEGVLDTLPTPYAVALKAAWNSWLQARYANEAAMLAAWEAKDEALGSALFTNGDFANGFNDWVLEQHTTAKATSSANATGYAGQPSVAINVTTVGSQGWHVQVTQGAFALQANQLYTLQFAAKANGAIPLSASLTRAGTGGDYRAVTSGLNLTLGTDWKTYTLTFVASAAEPNVRLVFNGFGDRLTTVSLAAVSLRTGGKIGGLEVGETLAAGNIGTVKRNASGLAPSVGQARDWMRFLFAREKSYWDTIYTHIKSTLGYPGIVFGTIISNSPPNTQSGLDAIDSHSYWQHPQFPAGQDWSAENWTVPNVSMVDNPAGSTLAGIARQRVKGKPHNVTEYQHPSPNTYGSEAPLLAAAYGALQDWDSLWMFAYNTSTDEYVKDYFDHGGHPGKMVNNLLAAALFRRGDVAPARRSYPAALTPETEVELARTRGGAWSIADGSHLGVPALSFTESRLQLVTGDQASAPSSVPAPASSSILNSDTEQLHWTVANGRGLLTVTTDRARGLVGRADGQSVDLGGVVLKPGTTRQGWCTLGVMLTEGRKFEELGAARGLIIATGDQENSGQVWKDSTKTSLGSKWGQAPVMVEVIPATVTLPYAAARVKVWALDVRGQRGSALTIRDRNGRAEFDLGASGATLWYEFEVSASGSASATVTQSPLPQVVSPGQPAVFSAAVEGSPYPTLQWTRNGTPIPGATGDTLRLASVSAGDLGDYQLLASNAGGLSTSLPARLAFATDTVPADTRLTNVSTRALIGPGEGVMIAGWVIAGQRTVLVRASGPKLSDFGLSGVLPDPTLDVRTLGATSSLFYNQDWDTALAPLFTTLGAFAFDGSPREAALRMELNPNGYTAIVQDTLNRSGIGLVEAYDTGVGSGRIVNLSTRAQVGTGGNALFVGFALSGPSLKKVLIRGVGPTLKEFNLTSAIDDPTLTLYRMVNGLPRKITFNDDWADYEKSGLSADFLAAGAFGLSTASRDSALSLWLEPGLYSAQMESKSGLGLGIVEVYELN